jgi:molybdopterin-guanine dinucleotide biosynthesis protein B
VDHDQRLREEVQGVIAIATNLPEVRGDQVFSLDQAKEIALFIEKRFLRQSSKREIATLLVNGERVPINSFIQEALAGTVAGFIRTLKLNHEVKEIDLRLKIDS